MGFPIRKYPDQSPFAAPQILSQRTTSFIASQRQGIHRILLRHLIALIVDARTGTLPSVRRRPASSGGRLCKQTATAFDAGVATLGRGTTPIKDQLLDHARERRGQAGAHKTENADAADTGTMCPQVPAAKPNMVPLHDVDWFPQHGRRSRGHPSWNHQQPAKLVSFRTVAALPPHDAIGARPSAPPRGGARRDRTDDLMLAKHALSQLSYGPTWVQGAQPMVGLGRLELPTSRLSSARSNQLSYKPPADRTTRRPRTGSARANGQGRQRLSEEEKETKAAASRMMPPRLKAADSKSPDRSGKDPRIQAGR